MWKLTIEQERKSSYIDAYVTDRLECEGDLQDLTNLVSDIANTTANTKITFVIERIEEEKNNESV